jgi:hypothetical protein
MSDRAEETAARLQPKDALSGSILALDLDSVTKEVWKHIKERYGNLQRLVEELHRIGLSLTGIYHVFDRGGSRTGIIGLDLPNKRKNWAAEQSAPHLETITSESSRRNVEQKLC